MQKFSPLKEHITDFWIIFVPSFIWKAVIDTQEWHKSDGRKHSTSNIQHPAWSFFGITNQTQYHYGTTTVPLYNITIKSTKMKPELIIPIETLSIPKSKTAKVVKYFIDKYRVEL